MEEGLLGSVLSVESDHNEPALSPPPDIQATYDGGIGTPRGRFGQPESQNDPVYSPGTSTMRSLDSLESVEDFVRDSLSNLEQRLEAVLDSMSDDLASEVSRERQHLLLMQGQVDNQARTLQHELVEMQKALEQERTQRALAQQSARESTENISKHLSRIAQELEDIHEVVAKLRAPWFVRLFGSVCGAFARCQGQSPSPRYFSML